MPSNLGQVLPLLAVLEETRADLEDFKQNYVKMNLEWLLVEKPVIYMLSGYSISPAGVLHCFS